MKFLSLLFIAMLAGCGIADKIQPENEIWKPALKNFIAAVKTDDPDKIGDNIYFPLRRDDPLPDVEDKADFITRYDVIFDDKLKSEIINSNIDKDWRRVGWRGIIFAKKALTDMPGAIWFQDAADGKLTAINYYSKKETELRNNLINKERGNLPKELRDYIENLTNLETDKFIIRIDLIKDGDGYIYRYASWNKPKSMSDNPDLVIKQVGAQIMDGSGGNHRYVFKNGKYIYECSINRIGASDTPPASLVIYKTDEDVDVKNFFPWSGKYDTISSARAEFIKK